jgi:ring-1,2-phenylacetyl-CoA epoxidase subunit PaaD
MSDLEDRVRAAVATVEDPEVPITLQDLGVVRDVRVAGGEARVVLRPTRLACPARSEMARRVHAAVLSAAPDVRVEVDWEMAAWRGSDVSDRGTQVLLQIGYADPGAGAATACPYCGSSDVRSEGAFGGAVCKVPFSCRSCGSTYDALKGSAAAAAVAGGSRG